MTKQGNKTLWNATRFPLYQDECDLYDTRPHTEKKLSVNVNNLPKGLGDFQPIPTNVTT